MTPDKENASQILVGLATLARQSVQPATPVQMTRGLRTLSLRLGRQRARRRLFVRGSLGLATVTAVLCLTWSFTARPRLSADGRPLAYRVEGGSVADGGYLRETDSAGMKLVFTEGTECTFLRGARGRLRSVDNLGAHLAIEQGSASFQVTPRPGARWLVDVGPFLVTVKGTVFAISWDAVAERFELRLMRGRVSVAGPVSGGEITLRAGQRLVVNLPKAETVISEQKPDEKPDDAWPASDRAGGEGPAERPNQQPAGASANAARAGRPGARMAVLARQSTRAEGRWSEAMAAGKWSEILADAERDGVEKTLDKASSEDLFALADAARYRRRDGLARQALQAERRRFPGSERALDATFLLGRMEEAADQDGRKALPWYEEYLTRAPVGTYASEALGRKMIVTSRLEGKESARPIAEDYLRRFPSGSYAGAARALRRGH